MVKLRTIELDPPLLNAACVWASDLAQLTALYDCPHTGGVTTRTATLGGFVEDGTHGVVFHREHRTTLNTYGYSPHPLRAYLAWTRVLLARPPPPSCAPRKPVVVSVAASAPDELGEALGVIGEFLRAELGSAGERNVERVGVEVNVGCPNIREGDAADSHPGGALGGEVGALEAFLRVVADFFRSDGEVALGVKLPPYTRADDVRAVVRALERVAGGGVCPVAWLVCTNTVGNAVLFGEETCPPRADGSSATNTNTFSPSPDETAAAPPRSGPGGLGGAAIHALALGNVVAFRAALDASSVQSVRDVVVVGAGGVDGPEARRRMVSAGAGAVECASVLGWEGVGAFARIGG
ncbi:FMN-linked oxidoreductase [Coniophora puteana RWD-64-598 SS2]|uniref:FMN-linked oxidoreductase n=1 Tax=Coniophora puteana (strain RWD-64-598) TaxID=741705 RepID=A0A5M3N4X9_CONPW|nr:FMN-linked oxidoreductase [Coniophora puteana RWD-64-598 SS2]EIW86356.1 FMN-linked oxidoreductase [Coniophora puteana RWD-64-598 SS2]